MFPFLLAAAALTALSSCSRQGPSSTGLVPVLARSADTARAVAPNRARTAAPPTLRLFSTVTGQVDPRYKRLPEALSTVELLPSSTLAAELPTGFQSVRFVLDGRVSIVSEPPFVLPPPGGAAVGLNVGRHYIEAQAFQEPEAKGPASSVARAVLQVTTAGTDASPSSGQHRTFSRWLGSSGQVLSLNRRGDFLGEQGAVAIPADSVQLTQQGAEQGHYITKAAHSEKIVFAFQLLLPEGYDPAHRYPLVLFLHHGWDVFRGTDNDGRIQKECPLFSGPRSLTRSSLRHRYPAVVLVPQMVRKQRLNGVEHEWGAFTALNNETGTVHSSAQPSRSAAYTFSVLERIMDGSLQVGGQTLRVDPHRIYLTGHSMGGLGTWDFLAREPGLWAAAIPMAGYPDHRTASRVRATPIWAFHHEADCYNPFLGSETMLELVTGAAGESPQMRLTKLGFSYGEKCEQAHFRTPAEALKTPELMSWLFSQARAIPAKFSAELLP